MIVERTFANAPQSVAQARRHALDVLVDVTPHVADAVAVMVSELATNSIRHAASNFIVSIDRTPQEIRVAVTDTGPGLPAVKAPAPTVPSGRGLRIITTFADDWGISPSHAASGKTVWFRVALSTSP
jgi:anti-sigma regulatory factor (Ser/Thr protein kinase)